MAHALHAVADSSWLDRPRHVPALAYALISVALLGLWVGFYLLNPFGFDRAMRDTWHHVAVLRELMAAPLAPTNPHIPTDEPSRYFTPVALLAALVGKALGVTPYTLFGYMGAVSCIGLVVGCWVFARRYFQSAWAPLALLLVFLFAWGAQVSHVGFHNYAVLLSSAAYPSQIALVLGLFSWALALRLLEADTNQLFHLALLSVLAATILLVHQLSGFVALLGTGSFILFHRRSNLRRKSALLAALAIGCLLTLAWPYFPILDVLFSVGDDRWKSPDAKINQLSTVALLTAPTLAGVLGFITPERKVRWELAAPALFLSLSFVVLTLTDSPIGHRLPPAVILYNQLGLVWLFLSLLRAWRPSPVRIAMVAAVCLLITASAIGAGRSRMQDLRSRDLNGSMIAMAGSLAKHIPPNSVSFATESIVFPLQSTGRRVVSIPRPEPAAPSLGQRQLATDRFFNADTGQDERRRLLDRWGATHVVIVPDNLPSATVRALRALGPSRAFSHGAEIITVSSPADERQ